MGFAPPLGRHILDGCPDCGQPFGRTEYQCWRCKAAFCRWCGDPTGVFFCSICAFCDRADPTRLPPLPAGDRGAGRPPSGPRADMQTDKESDMQSDPPDPPTPPPPLSPAVAWDVTLAVYGTASPTARPRRGRKIPPGQGSLFDLPAADVGAGGAP